MSEHQSPTRDEIQAVIAEQLPGYALLPDDHADQRQPHLDRVDLAYSPSLEELREHYAGSVPADDDSGLSQQDPVEPPDTAGIYLVEDTTGENYPRRRSVVVARVDGALKIVAWSA